jgi:hypothetical protein
VSAETDAEPRVIAANAIVVLVSARQKSAGVGAGDERVVLVALPAPAANALAGASLVQTVTLTIH